MARRLTRQTGKAAVNGTRLYYERTGAGSPVVFVSTETADRRIWDDQVVPFAQRYEVVRYDPRGAGRSAFGRGPCRYDADLAALLNRLGLERSVLVGFYRGAETALELALDHPEQVRALVLVSPALNKFTRNEELAEAFDRLLFVDGPVPPRAYRGRRRKVLLRVSRQRTYNNVRFLWHTYWPPFSSRLAPDKWPHWPDPPAIVRLGEIANPTLVVRGAEAVLWRAKVAEVVQREIAGAQLAVVAGSAIYPQIEAPAAFNSVVQEFLASVYPPRRSDSSASS
jgi:pimeloyl-ACP methyl ester carboxylesterase